MISPEYAAGFFDGEGCVNVSPGRNGVYTLLVSVSNTNLEILNSLKEKYGGNIHTKNKYKDNHTQAYTWAVCKYQRFISDILPHLRIKKNQAELAIKFEKTIDRSTGSKKLGEEIKNKRKEIYIKIKELNNK